MKVEELMIGDWVQIDYRDKVVQVTGILDKVITTNAVSPLSEDEFKPILLTPGILEKNGFKKLGFDGWECGYREDEDQIFEILWRCDYSDCTHLTITNYQANYGSFKSFNIDYVHELQHALKLCGIEKEIVL